MDSVVAELRKTEKGQLKYFTEWSPKELADDIKPPKLRKSVETVFEIRDIKVALEAIDDEAGVYIENIDEENVWKEREESFQKEQESEDEFESFVGSDDPLREFEAELEMEKRIADRERVRQQEKFYETISKKCLETARIRREKEREKRRQREEEMVRKFRKESEESALRIKREMQSTQAQQDYLLKTRQQQRDEMKRKLELLELQKQKDDFLKFSKILGEIQTKYKETLSKVQEFASSNSAEISTSKIPSFLSNMDLIFKRENGVFDGAKAVQRISEQQLKQSENDLELLKNLSVNIFQEIKDIALKIEDAKNRAEKARQETIMMQQRKAAEAEKRAKEEAKAKSEAAKNIPTVKQLYMTLKSKMTEYEGEGQKLTKSGNRDLKMLVMDLSRAVSVPVASITDRSGSDLKRQKRILVNILKGEKVSVGNKMVSTRGNESAKKFAVNLVAKKIVSQANDQVSSNFTSAFSIAFIVLGIWGESPDFGDLFLAHLHAKCIYTVPMTLLKKDSQSDSDYQKDLGYIVSQDGTVEQQDKYLRRMSGLVRLYAAVIQSPLPPGVSVHPHGLSKGWAWLAEMLNMEPQPDVSATVLYDFLEVAGHALMNSYRVQFEKLLFLICHDYYPKLEEVTGPEHRAPLIRLKNFLEKCIKEKAVPVPKGRLDKGFWNTYHSGEVVGE